MYSPCCFFIIIVGLKFPTSLGLKSLFAHVSILCLEVLHYSFLFMTIIEGFCYVHNFPLESPLCIGKSIIIN